MNEYNHHRIIERVAFNFGIDSSVKKQFIEASDFADFFIGFFDTNKPIQEWKETAKQKYYFYRFYYNINIKNGNTISLDRVTSNGFSVNNSIRCMENAGEKGLDGKCILNSWSGLSDEKEFFSSVNNRKRSPKSDKGDTANQSDNVAFLHAMGAKGEAPEDKDKTAEDKRKSSRTVFEEHLKKCFAEYLFLEDTEQALFMLGIAFHGIMDSFTPSHMGFQKYTEQDMGLHAQGDVIPILNNKFHEEEVIFDPGQFKKEIPRNQFICITKKRFDGNDVVNPVEYWMLRIFLTIGNIQLKTKDNFWKDADELWKELKGKLISEINHKIGNRGKYRFGPKSYAYSEAAITVISSIYKLLSRERTYCSDYTYYKEKKIEIIEKAMNYWIDVYDGKKNIDYTVKYCETNAQNGYKVITPIGEESVCLSMKDMREGHMRLSLYSKDNPELEREYKEWVAQQDIDRLNRLKG